MGAKFRVTPPCKKNELNYLYRDAIEQLTKIFDSWKYSAIQEIDKVLKSLPITFESSFIMDRPEVRQYMNYLHDRFVIVPVAKASNNFGILCKSFCLDVIENELGISDDGNIISNTVYKPICQKVNDIYTFHEKKLLSTFWYEVTQYQSL